MYNNLGNVSSTNAANPGSPIFLYPDFYQPYMVPLPPPPPPPPPPSSLPHFAGGGDGGAAAADEFPVGDERFPQWSYQETADFVEIRAQVEWETTTSEEKKNLWEMVVNRMREKGYCRTIDQCKSKWKNLVNRYKAQEASDIVNGQQCPFFYKLHALFTARDNRLHQAQPDSEVVPIKGKKRAGNTSGYQSHEEYSEEQENEDNTNAAMKNKAGRGKRQKKEKPDKQYDESVVSSIREILRNFMKQQQRMDIQLKEAMAKHAQEREVFEHEWKQTMEKLERERVMMEQAWMEREEQRRLREESRAEKRDALLTILLNKLIAEENL